MTSQEEIRSTLARYAHSFDERDWDGYAGTFTEDGTLISQGRAYVGRAAIKELLERNSASRPADRRTRHLCANAAIVVSGETAVATSDVLVYERIANGPWQVFTTGRYYDELIRRCGTWLFNTRRIETS